MLGVFVVSGFVRSDSFSDLLFDSPIFSDLVSLDGVEFVDGVLVFSADSSVRVVFLPDLDLDLVESDFNLFLDLYFDDKVIQFLAVADSQNLDSSLIRISIGGVVYRVLMNIDVKSFFVLCDSERLLSISLGRCQHDISAFEKASAEWRESYDELLSYRDEIVSVGGDGYSSLFKDELESVYDDAMGEIKFLSAGLKKSLEADFFRNRRSFVEDLSFVDGVLCYNWMSSFHYRDVHSKKDSDVVVKNFVIKRFGLEFLFL